MSIHATVEAVIEGLKRNDPVPFIAMMAEDAVLELPLQPELPQAPIRGKAAIADYMQNVRVLHRVVIELRGLYVDEAQQVAVLELTSEVVPTPGADAMHITGVTVIPFRDGQAIAWRDYRGMSHVPAALHQ